MKTFTSKQRAQIVAEFLAYHDIPKKDHTYSDETGLHYFDEDHDGNLEKLSMTTEELVEELEAVKLL